MLDTGTPKPAVSVIMPCYNHCEYVPQAIEGVLRQTYEDLELIIVDDCSTDGSRNVIEKYRQVDKRIVSIYHDKNMGVSRSRNNALRECSGDYIAFCDSDDIWEKNKLEVQVNYLDSNQEIAVVHCDSTIIDERGCPTGKKFSWIYGSSKRSDGNVFFELCLSNFINTQTVVIRRECLQGAGYFEEGLKYNEDWIYWIKLATLYRFHFINLPLARYRMHEASTNRDVNGFNRERIKSCSFILNNFPELPGTIIGDLLYKIGRDHADLGNRIMAFKFFLQSIKAGKRDLRVIWYLLLLFIRGWK